MPNGNDILLTIAIPTYNRSGFLDTCLKYLTNQLSVYNSLVEIVICDNNSEDDTERVVQKYLNECINLKYIKNETNIGADANILQCYKVSIGKYVLVLGDDDILIEGALQKILSILKQDEYGIIYLSCYGYDNNFFEEKPRVAPKYVYTIYTDKYSFIRKVNYNFTFISSNICNKKLIMEHFGEGVDKSTFQDIREAKYNSWIVSALLSSEKHVFVHDYMIAAKKDNSGGYNLCRTFGREYNIILSFFINKGFAPKYIRHINNKLLSRFFPYYLLRIRERGSDFLDCKEEFYSELYDVYKNYFLFWIIILPLIRLPLTLAKIWFIITKDISKIGWVFFDSASYYFRKLRYY